MRSSRLYRRWDIAESRWDLAERLERLAADAYVATAPGSNPGIYLHSGIWGAADEAVLILLNTYWTWNKENPKNPPVKVLVEYHTGTDSI